MIAQGIYRTTRTTATSNVVCEVVDPNRLDILLRHECIPQETLDMIDWLSIKTGRERDEVVMALVNTALGDHTIGELSGIVRRMQPKELT